MKPGHLYSEEAEQALLAIAFLTPHRVDEMIARLDVDAFHLERNRLLWDAILSAHSTGTDINYRTVQDVLERRGTFERSGGLAYMAGLDQMLPDVGRLDALIEIVVDRWTRRKLVSHAEETLQAAHEAEDAADAADQAHAELLKISTAAAPHRAVSLADAVDHVIESIERREEARPGDLLGIPTGLPSLDRILLGLQAGQMVVLSARPSVGKTALGVQIAAHAAERGHPVFYGSLEMSSPEIAARLLSCHGRVPLRSIRTARWAGDDVERFVDATRATLPFPMEIADHHARLAEIVSGARRFFARQGRPGLVVVDYLQLLPAPAGIGKVTRYEVVTANSNAIKQAARSLEAPVLALCQLSRDAQNRRPTLADHRDSGAIEQDADVVVAIHRDPHAADHSQRERGDLLILKHRNGALADIPVRYVGAQTRFEEVDTFR
ncbi:MAG: DnaB-like helicase C-terminal domain-containing protein [Acidobacteriota bacterium]